MRGRIRAVEEENRRRLEDGLQAGARRRGVAARSRLRLRDCQSRIPETRRQSPARRQAAARGAARAEGTGHLRAARRRAQVGAAVRRPLAAHPRQRPSHGGPDEHFYDFVYQPIVDPSGAHGSDRRGDLRRHRRSRARAARRRSPAGRRTSSSPCSGTSCATRWRRCARRCELLRLRGVDGADERAAGHRAPGRPPASARRRSARRLPHHARQGPAAARSRVEVADVVAKAIETASPLLEQQGHALRDRRARAPVSWSTPTPTRLAQVLANLLTNAAKYTEAARPGLRLAPPPMAKTSSIRVRDTASASRPTCCRASSICSSRSGRR